MIKTAVVLAAGQGTRSWPFGETRPKAAFPIANVPLVQRIVEGLKNAGVGRILVVAGYRAGQVRHAVGDVEGVEFLCVANATPTPAGTASALLAALPAVEEEAFLVVYGDVVMAEANYATMCAVLDQADAAAVALVAPLGAEDSQDWLCAQVVEGGVRRIVGHPRGGVTHRLCGVYVMRRDLVPYVRRNPGVMTSVEVGMMPPDEAELAQSVQDAIADGLQVAALEVEGYFVDVDKPWHIAQANEAVAGAILARMCGQEVAPSAHISPQARIEGNIVLGAHSVLGPGVVVRGDLWVGAHTVLDTGAILEPNTLLGDHCRVEQYGMAGGVLGHHTRVGHASEVYGLVFGNFNTHFLQFSGIVGYGTDLGAGTSCGTLRFDDRERGVQAVRGRKEFLADGANWIYIGDYCRTGVNCAIMPGCKIGPYSVIGAGVVLNEDVPSHTLVYVEQTLVRKGWPGPDVYGW